MPARDIYHQAVKAALEKEGWIISDDPLIIPTPGVDFYIDIGEEQALLEAKREESYIAVEVKALKGNSTFYDYHQAFGQYLIYRLALEMTDSRHIPFLAIPEQQYIQLKKADIYPKSWRSYNVNLLIFDEHNEKIIEWKTTY